MRRFTEVLQERNATERRQVDAVFGERIQAESAIKELEAQVGQHQEEMRLKLSELPPVKRREYQQLAGPSTYVPPPHQHA